MRVVVQRVSQAWVEVEGRTVGRIGRGLLLLLGIEKGDGEREVDFLAEKVAHLRIFADSEGKMNLSVKDIAGAVLSISQFTLASDIGKGRRPDFANAAEPARAEALYGRFNEQLAAEVPLEKGVFGARMAVHLINDGPVTFIIEKRFENSMTS